MDVRRLVLKETAAMAVGQTLCVAAMLGIFTLLGHFDPSVLWGGILGGLLAVLNHFFLAVGVMMAADKAQGEDVKGGKNLVQFSFALRTVLLFIILFALLKSGLCNIFALLLPLLFTKPILLLDQFFRKDGEAKP